MTIFHRRRFPILAALLVACLHVSIAIGQDDNPPAEPDSPSNADAADPPPSEPAVNDPTDNAASSDPNAPADDAPVEDAPNDAPEPDDAQPDEAQPDEAQPDDAQPDDAQPDDAQSDDTPEPGDTEPDEPQPPAELTDPLALQAIQAKESFQPITAERVAAAREAAVKAANTLEKMIRRGDDAYEQSWKEFLLWDDLQAGLAADEPDYQALTKVYDRFRFNVEGLEMSKFLATRDSLQSFLNLSYGATQANLQQAHGQILDRLANRLQLHADAPSTDHAEEIGRLMGWLDRYDQSADLTRAISKKYSRPNLLAEVSKNFVATGMQQDVNRPTNVTQCILGTSISGHGFTIASTTAELVPNDSQASLNLILSGVSNTTNVGVNGPVTIHSTASTSFRATLPLQFDADGLSAGRASATADSNSQITGIGAKMRLIRKIATKRVYQSKPQAEAIASRVAADRVASELNAESGGMVREANDNFTNKFRHPLTRRDAFPDQLDFRTTSSRINVVSMKAGPAQLAAFNEAPSLNAAYDMALRLHESSVSNYTEDLIGGETLTDEKLVEMIEESGREVPEELKITPETDPWSITFATEQPASVRFANNTIKIAIRGRRFTRQDTAITKAAEISALYTVEKTDMGAKLVRQGDVEVTYLSRGRQSFAETAFKAFLVNKFEGLFKPEFEFTGLQLPGRFEQVGPLQLEQLEVDNAWAAFGWVIPPAGAE